MKALLDTHAFLDWLVDSDRLSATARELFQQSGSELLWSAASSWEVAIKYALGRMEFAKPPGELLDRQTRLILLEET